MRLPRDLDGVDLVKALRSCGYELTRQTGSHMRLTASVNGEHHVTVALMNYLSKRQLEPMTWEHSSLVLQNRPGIQNP
jgi:predicted RNA binding protein YcfA (HicA-like mRNA interferase family)